jgi:quercetin dioxygenase-like cupin family protein
MDSYNDASRRRLDFLPLIDMQWEITRTAEETGGALFEVVTRLGPRTDGPAPHAHAAAEDSFEVVEGRLDVELDGVWRTLGPGEHVAAAPGVLHTLRNATDEDVRLINRHRPAQRFEGLFRDLESLIHQGKLQSFPPKGPRAAIYGSMLFRRYPDEMRTSAPQRVVFAVMAGIGRALGMRIDPS